MREPVVGYWGKDGESSSVIVLYLGTSRENLVEEHNALCGICCSAVGRGEAMECLVCQDEDLKENLLAYREQVELYEEGGHMIMFMRPSDQLGSSVLDGLQRQYHFVQYILSSIEPCFSLLAWLLPNLA